MKTISESPYDQGGWSFLGDAGAEVSYNYFTSSFTHTDFAIE